MADQFVDNIWLRRVFWGRVVSDVLSGIEYFESQAVKELTLSKETSNGLESPAGFAAQVFANIVELGNGFFGKTRNISFKLCHDFNALLACILAQQSLKFGIAMLPNRNFLLSIVNMGNLRVT